MAEPEETLKVGLSADEGRLVYVHCHPGESTRWISLFHLGQAADADFQACLAPAQRLKRAESLGCQTTLSGRRGSDYQIVEVHLRRFVLVRTDHKTHVPLGEGRVGGLA